MESSKSRQHWLAGASAGLINCVMVQPLDVIKTRMQQPRTTTISSPIRFWKTCSEIASEPRGFPGFWRGTWATVIRNVPGSSLYFVVLNAIRSSLARKSSMENPVAGIPLGAERKETYTHFMNLAAGSSARMMVGLGLMPFTVVKVRFESNLYNYKNVTEALRAIFRTEGMKGLFAGYGSTALRDAPFAGLYVLIYEHGKNTLKPFEATSNPYSGTLINAASASVAGCLATAITQPFDVIRAHIQLQPDKYKNVLMAPRKIVEEKGVRGFVAGLVPRLFRRTFSAVITWTLYEEFLKIY